MVSSFGRYRANCPRPSRSCRAIHRRKAHTFARSKIWRREVVEPVGWRLPTFIPRAEIVDIHWLKSIDQATRATWRPCEQPRSCWASTSLSCTGDHRTREPKRLPSICSPFRALQHCTARWRPCIPGCSGSRPAGFFGRRGWQPRTCCWALVKPEYQQGRNLLMSTTRRARARCRSERIGPRIATARWFEFQRLHGMGEALYRDWCERQPWRSAPLIFTGAKCSPEPA